MAEAFVDKQRCLTGETDIFLVIGVCRYLHDHFHVVFTHLPYHVERERVRVIV